MQSESPAILSPTQSDLLSRFKHVRATTEKLCAPLQTEDYVVQPVVDVSPPKWHIGHTTWFFEEFVLDGNLPGYERFDPQYAYLFNSYYEGVGKRVVRTDRGNMTRPSVEEVYQYRAYVDQQLECYLQEHSLPAEVAEKLELGLQHEQQHQELLLYDIKFILGGNPLFPPYRARKAAKEAAQPVGELQFLPMEEGVYEIGWGADTQSADAQSADAQSADAQSADAQSADAQSADAQSADGPGRRGFCFDNELGRHKVYLQAYAIADRLVTNGEWLEFMEAGGYRYFRHWMQEGWQWVQEQGIQAPYHWHRIDGQWQRFSLHGLEPVDLQEPVTHISFYEADAYAKWRGLRLPTEQEWEAACRKHSPAPPAYANFQDSELFEPAVRSSGNRQFWGDVWEWTGSAYRPYPYFSEAPGPVGEYNGKFMINQMVLRGGSCATPRDHIRASYRNFFHPQLRWLFSGLRLAKQL
ncbi:ergothioneine biosynthesis protein EgtB [Cesiribacter andamanensis]|uniref:Iron(II)-dependent oxidoreductase EgtB n=1 Tax=Cesiribacter andamanensis AMV16 TaxID=1279009 RepID=M7N7X3_9BACT|nr:ergothioneine biosynthesis protein EgtB [Cesiribacter andamanensis]EMR03347.1 Iron(II)-dependent oxidoreductase EgtB [Cesiribacter andamanensis AMV16]